MAKLTVEEVKPKMPDFKVILELDAKEVVVLAAILGKVGNGNSKDTTMVRSVTANIYQQLVRNPRIKAATNTQWDIMNAYNNRNSPTLYVGDCPIVDNV